MSEEHVVSHGVVIEADAVLFDSINTACEAMADNLGKIGITSDRFTFLKKCFGSTFRRAFEAIEPAYDKREMMQDLAEDAKAAYLAGIQQNARISDEFAAFAKAIFAGGLRVIVITHLHEDVAEELFSGLAADGSLSVVMDTGDTVGVTGCEVWRKAATRYGISPRNAVAVCASGSSMKGAVSAGMHAIVKLDELTAFEDCGGADILTEQLDASLVAPIKTMLKI